MRALMAALGSAELIDPGPHAGRVVVTRQPQQRLPAFVLKLESGIPWKAVSPVGPDHLQVSGPDVPVIPVRYREHAGHPPALMHRPKRERARADAIDQISGLDDRTVGDAVTDRVQDDRHVLD